MEVNGVEYRFIIASHVFSGRNGLALECWRDNDNVFEIFRNDAKFALEVTFFEPDVPFNLVAHAVRIAPESLGEFVP